MLRIFWYIHTQCIHVYIIAGDKTALLIGIGDIVGERRLYAPHNDLAIMQECLEGLKFKVYSYYNLQRKQMLEMVRLYASRLGEKTYSE